MKRVAGWMAMFFLAYLGGETWASAARPGGGQHYSAPSSRSTSSSSRSYSGTTSHSSSGTSYSGGGGGGGGGDVDITFVLLIIVVIVVVAVIVARLKKASADRASVSTSNEARHAGLTALISQDPAFDEAAFAERCKRMMTAFNQAWTKGQMGPARRFASDGVYTRFQTQLQLLKKGGLRNVMVDAKPVAAEVVAATADASWDTLHVKMVGEARDADVSATLSDADAEKKAKSAPLLRYEEVWSFVRRRGRKSKAGVPALEGACANCGAELPSGDVVRCDTCKALTNSGEHDWVLAEITQPEEWSASGGEDPQGLTELRQRDPALSRQELEDRASVVFWKWIEARVTGDRKGFERFCFEPGSVPAEFAKLTKVAVGAADLIEVTAADTVSPDELDDASIEIKWSASVDGAEPTPMDPVEIHLVRPSTASSKRGLSCLNCPNCGGPVPESDAVTCAYCKEPLVGSKKEWTVDAIS